ncbi:16S rRNA G966 N2-methylase RsmD [Paenibacillus phyllosphaerae]|uniref:16S rRNA G966 N2-methylase RsmD n=1 Tax=Paenibacillus phyllosphaerae TaxID=274593 RepID=A0A7W5B1M2_9BACL|nr:RsmD family RNA methyltransferase [Paenibacillus phyllosphaerae]MBB3112216.1 16S rRNA G966 N2-methylase RsmD [Paenibacillus phyllosphaerae]
MASTKAADRYLYQISYHEDEAELCFMEMRALLGAEPEEGCIVTDRELPPSRSPFIRQRLAVLLEAAELDELASAAAQLDMEGRTYKAIFVATGGSQIYEERLAIERQIGRSIRGRADMKQPERLIGIAYARGQWLLGELERAEAAWLVHNQKPQPYSTALSTRVARAVANIAAPYTEGVKVIDPCCGIGTVIIEAISMGIDIVGCDVNPLAVRGARTNLAHYGMPNVVRLLDMRQAEGSYDAAIIDLPYNLCSVMEPEERIEMLRSAGRLAPRVVIVTTEQIDEDVAAARLVIADRCVVRKSRFERQVLLCSRQ